MPLTAEPLTAETAEEMIRQAMAAGDWQQVHTLADQLDAVATPKPPVPLVAAALWYAEQGLKVFPLQPGSKQPYRGSHGFEDATSDPRGVADWWRLRPSSNVGIATGHVIDVIDIDGPEGVQSWAQMSLPPALGTVSTPRAGGAHLYIPAGGRGNRAKIAPGIDYRGLGGYVVAPPSVNSDGAYTWRHPLRLAPPPPPPKGRSGATAQQGTCQICGLAMVVVEAGQTTHPCCEPMAAA